MPTISFEAWPDEVLDTLGHHAGSDYVETYWLPIIGPSSLLVARRVARDLTQTDRVTYPGDLLAASMGLAPKQLDRTLARLAQFDLLSPSPGENHHQLRCHFAPLTRARIARLPLALAMAHEHEQRRAVRGAA